MVLIASIKRRLSMKFSLHLDDIQRNALYKWSSRFNIHRARNGAALPPARTLIFFVENVKRRAARFRRTSIFLIF